MNVNDARRTHWQNYANQNPHLADTYPVAPAVFVFPGIVGVLGVWLTAGLDMVDASTRAAAAAAFGLTAAAVAFGAWWKTANTEQAAGNARLARALTRFAEVVGDELTLDAVTNIHDGAFTGWANGAVDFTRRLAPADQEQFLRQIVIDRNWNLIDDMVRYCYPPLAGARGWTTNDDRVDVREHALRDMLTNRTFTAAAFRAASRAHMGAAATT